MHTSNKRFTLEGRLKLACGLSTCCAVKCRWQSDYSLFNLQFVYEGGVLYIFGFGTL